MAADLEVIRERYQIPAEVELLLPTSRERPSTARPREFSLYEEALKDPVKEQARKEGEVLKKKKKKRSAPEEAADESGAKRAKVAPTEVEVPVAKDAPEVVEVILMVEVVEIAPTVQVEAGLTEAAPSGREQELGEKRARAEEEKGRLLREWESEKAKATAELESLKKGVEEERAMAAAERGALQRELDEERAKAASEREAYPDLCVAAVEQYKGSPEFQMAVDAAVARSLARQESGGVGPSRKTVGGRTEAEPPKNFPSKDLKKLLDLPIQRRKAPLVLNFIPTYKLTLPDVLKRKKKSLSPPSATTLQTVSTSRADQGSTSDPASQPSTSAPYLIPIPERKRRRRLVKTAEMVRPKPVAQDLLVDLPTDVDAVPTQPMPPPKPRRTKKAQPKTKATEVEAEDALPISKLAESSKSQPSAGKRRVESQPSESTQPMRRPRGPKNLMFLGLPRLLWKIGP
ncbi:uncharacterized protein LOC114312370 [Camellia sinensis]|uniref:uncharacterized protein LOC114312370 n=1 Tax=Camellia sinensis TaxID=4442 RepID=UPI00103635A6|nr:uncharacterized protein LOC114312370 [Camellia sinensis]